MKALRTLVWSGAPVLAVVAGVVMVGAAASEREFFTGYQLNAHAAAWLGLVVLVPLVSAWAAWHACRLRPWLDEHCCGTWRRVMVPVRMTALGLLLTVVVTVVTVGVSVGVPASAGVAALAVAALVTLVAAYVVGLALGTTLPRVTVVPCAVALTYAAMAVPVALPDSSASVSTLTGSLALCCVSTRQVAMTTVIWATVVAASTALLGLLVIRMSGPTRRRNVMLASALVAGPLMLGWLGAPAVGAGLRERSEHVVCGHRDGVDVCLWPENRAELVSALQEVTRARAILRVDGIDTPTMWTERPQNSAAVIITWVPMSLTEHRRSLAVSLALALGCTDVQEERVAAYLARRLGAPEAPPSGSSLVPAGADASWLKSQVEQCR